LVRTIRDGVLERGKPVLLVERSRVNTRTWPEELAAPGCAGRLDVPIQVPSGLAQFARRPSTVTTL
jgi:hypothetical protein